MYILIYVCIYMHVLYDLFICIYMYVYTLKAIWLDVPTKRKFQTTQLFIRYKYLGYFSLNTNQNIAQHSIQNNY